MAVDARIPGRARSAQPKAQFRCDVCRHMVVATEHGVCPTCGREPVLGRRIRLPEHATALSWPYALALALSLAGLAAIALT